MEKLELKVPPLLLVCICLILMWWLGGGVTHSAIPMIARIFILFSISVLAIVVCLLGVWEFKLKKTTINLISPKSSHHLVQTGIYKYSRNPMYLSFVLFLTAFAVFLSSVYATVVPIFIGYITMFQIKPEEAVLRQLFGNDYREYAEKARRWL